MPASVERRSRETRDARNEGTRLAPSVTRVVICVSRAFCSTEQEKWETARSLRNLPKFKRWELPPIKKNIAQDIKIMNKWHNKYKKRHEWTNLKKTKTDCNLLVRLKGFQSSFLLLVTFGIMAHQAVIFHPQVIFWFLKFQGRSANKDA